MNNWQPIETAPKDGTEVLVWVKGWPTGYCDIVHWHSKWGCWRGQDGCLYLGNKTPTHWQPLPSAPL